MNLSRKIEADRKARFAHLSTEELQTTEARMVRDCAALALQHGFDAVVNTVTEYRAEIRTRGAQPLPS